MNEHDDVMCQVRESFSVLRMDVPVERVFARGRVRRRRLSALTSPSQPWPAPARQMKRNPLHLPAG